MPRTAKRRPSRVLRSLGPSGTIGRAARRLLPRRRWPRRIVVALLIVFVALPAVGTATYRVVPAPVTPLMLIRLAEGEGLARDWVPLEQVSRHMPLAVLAGEDNLFCRHHGFDLEQIRAAIDDWRAGEGLRGASTVSMQTAKNLFLWPGRDVVRKGFEAYLTVWLEAFWPKRRIMEAYLNVAEFAPGVYGVEAAARHHFGVAAADLSPTQAARLAAVLPSPRRWSASNPGPYVQRRTATLVTRMNQIAPIVDCL